MDLKFVERLIRSLDASSLDSLEIERGGTRIRLSKTPPAGGAPAHGMAPAPLVMGAPAPAVAPAPLAVASAPVPAPSDAGAEAGGAPEATLLEVKSPMVGTFYRAPSPDSDSFTDVGKRITVGQPLCIIEAMKLMNELESEVEGTVREVCVQNGQPVEYGQVLFRVQPD
jgi:acetyl-CoA carboxylase biotin carboxyl carrier protein